MESSRKDSTESRQVVGNNMKVRWNSLTNPQRDLLAADNAFLRDVLPISEHNFARAPRHLRALGIHADYRRRRASAMKLRRRACTPGLLRLLRRNARLRRASARRLLPTGTLALRPLRRRHRGSPDFLGQRSPLARLFRHRIVLVCVPDHGVEALLWRALALPVFSDERSGRVSFDARSKLPRRSLCGWAQLRDVFPCDYLQYGGQQL